MSDETYEEARTRAIALLTEEKYEHLETVRELLVEAKDDSRVDAVKRMIKEWAISSQHGPDEAAGILVAQISE